MIGLADLINLAMVYKVVVSGSRDWTDKEKVQYTFKRYITAQHVLLIHGNCRGLDKIAGEIGHQLGYRVKIYPAEWDQYGLSAAKTEQRNVK